MKKRSQLFLLTQIIFSVLFLGCDDDPESPLYDVYVSGRRGNAAIVWLNGTIQTELPNTFLTGSFVSGKDFYVAGCFQANVTTKIVAKYWKNGSETSLSNGTIEERAEDIVVSGSDVYVAGWEADLTLLRAKYWKNGDPVILGNDVNISGALDVTVSGSDLYISSWENINDNDSVVARVWKNGIRMSVPTNSRYSEVEAMAVNGNDVHLVGYESYPGSVSKAKYWKNRVGTYLDDDAYATDISINGSDIYIVGVKSGKAGFWKNGQFTPLSDQPSEALSIVIRNDDIFIAGNLDNSSSPKGIVWKNGVAMAPFLGTDPSFRVTGVVTAER